MEQSRNMLIKMLLSLLNLLRIIKTHVYSFMITLRDDKYHKLPGISYFDRVVLQNHNNLFPEVTPSPWLVPLPVHCIAESVKNQLPAVQNRGGKTQDSDYGSHTDTCIVCTDKVEGGQRVRELSNCSHVFHKECLDAWIDEGQFTCPLCRSNLLPKKCTTPEPKGHERELDSWRAERMIYLFGDDYQFMRMPNGYIYSSDQFLDLKKCQEECDTSCSRDELREVGRKGFQLEPPKLSERHHKPNQHNSTESHHRFHRPELVAVMARNNNDDMGGKGVAKPRPHTPLNRHPHHHHHEPKEDKTIVPRAEPSDVQTAGRKTLANMHTHTAGDQEAAAGNRINKTSRGETATNLARTEKEEQVKYPQNNPKTHPKPQI
ncbi:E3 ubiquitin-protein ligase RHA2A-like [Pyrus ussuriensis x Pyrus communis]|uniref:E3 ubiquitin-protein ligase RHA2A-like n=1 Tax=Pyrus ussuriensis x Pyrus communis TaxID=2448454 RepID=A0A5N5F6L5_9ROSA|nr:E3 ubiquitin-protein ligase RHA2A-like [Pyrus ussuriensis x Pyrus communis]